jgi:hypothetical protein
LIANKNGVAKTAAIKEFFRISTDDENRKKFVDPTGLEQ